MSEIPTLVHDVLNDYIALVNDRLPNTLQAVYLQGPLALGAYVGNSSDRFHRHYKSSFVRGGYGHSY